MATYKEAKKEADVEEPLKGAIEAIRQAESEKLTAACKAHGILTGDEYERHPLAIAADYREMTPAEFSGLMVSMEDKGQLFPIVLYEKKILDGWNRIIALTKLNIPVGRWKIVEPKFKNDAHAKGVMEALNAHRRHETFDDKKKHALKLVAENSKLTNRKVALAIGIDDKTVAKIRREAKPHSENPNDDARVDSLGRKSPAHKNRKPSKEAKAVATAKKEASSNWKAFFEQLTTYLDTLGGDEAKLDDALNKIDKEIVGRINSIFRKRTAFPHPHVDDRQWLEYAYENYCDHKPGPHQYIKWLIEMGKLSPDALPKEDVETPAVEVIAPGLLAKEGGSAEEQKSA